MKSYRLKGMKCAAVKAAHMTRGAYLKSRGWALPEGEDPADVGMRIVYLDSAKISWMGAEEFGCLYEEVEDAPVKAHPFKRFMVEVAKLALSMFAVAFVMVLTTCSSNEARIKDYRHLEAKIDALAEAQGLRFVEGEE